MDRSILAQPLEELPGIEYRRAVVTFIDILGFRSFVSKTPANEVAAAIGRLQEATAPPQPSKKSNKTPVEPPQVHGFSDCVVRVRPVEEGGDFGPTLSAELADLAAIQASLARAGVFVRGGVTWNDIYSTDTLVFGPALMPSQTCVRDECGNGLGRARSAACTSSWMNPGHFPVWEVGASAFRCRVRWSCPMRD